MARHRFWYIHASTEKHAFLLDLIRRPARIEARLAVDSPDGSRIVRASRPLSTLKAGHDPLEVACEDLSFSRTGCHGKLDAIEMDLKFRLDDTTRFAPRWLPRLARSIPDLSSRYGILESGTCQGIEYHDAPLVYASYSIGRLETAEWLLVSAPGFSDCDLRLELSAIRAGSRWLGSVFCHYRGERHELHGLTDSLRRIDVEQAVPPGEGEPRVVAAFSTRRFRLELTATASEDEFLLLEREGRTLIHTSLRATVSVHIEHADGTEHTHRSSRTCLLEFKHERDPEVFENTSYQL